MLKTPDHFAVLRDFLGGATLGDVRHPEEWIKRDRIVAL